MAVKLNNSDEYEPIEILITKNRFPKVFEARVRDLVSSGLTRKEAERVVETTPMEFEIYANDTNLVFLVESGAVESGTIYDPYNGILVEDADEIE